ncbi:hypothetical protein Q8A67_001510 [Cirrhinus molitorella]|uniref:Peptidase S1 domain-containing protein n=1 Tax=Cirrhinus molitorella TaxID=172907 RepID=A0AA88QBM1_9TELE|nr:hypothetical protein Q8A67_001510 [Cirrhinus molitorella]
MDRTLYAILLIGALCQLDVCGQVFLNDRIVGGEDATAGAWPWQVSIHVGFGHNCGGTLISKDWVLSAARCFQNFLFFKVVMYFGRLTQSGTNPYEASRTASQIIKHPLFQYPNPDHDIALVKLSSSVAFSDFIRPVSLAAAGSVFAAGTESWVTGWGLLQPEGPPSNTLQEVMIPVVSNSECANVYEGVTSITSNMICAGQEGKSICPGDSGGPLLSRKGSLCIQSGIMSFSRNLCYDLKHPSVFTRVSQYQDWIKLHMGSNPPGFVQFNTDIHYSWTISPPKDFEL